jgi:hypothetical protein
MPHLFTYGTLMFPEVWQAVVGKEFQTLPAQLPNFQIFRVKDAVYPGIIAAIYPGIIAEPSGSDPISESPRAELGLTPSPRRFSNPGSPLPFVPGLLYLTLDPASIARLDAFEDDFYVRQTITVACKGVTCEDCREFEAQAYVVPPESAHLLTNEIWTPGEFAARGHLAEFVSRYSGFNRLS